ncbi:hypothetical protein N658DRAFT_565173 [Parathielavia hyrcaniae]|uniref:Uncharacterized protein n=1 Tax=Parathielavia hyrcaniae TaxID=113614 RepID=A0AAN6T521_9PEZI|nr:hypothetical protein N658DRAFT_565173 [Parathielavia hyrcaniae]
MAKSGLSLDSRLQLRPDDLAIHYAGLSQDSKNSHHGVQIIDSAIRNLALNGVAIRRIGKASRSRRADRTFNPEKYHKFRKHLECVILLRPTEDGRHPDELDPSKLSALQRRLIDANLRRRHRFLLAQRRSRNQEVDQKQHPVLKVTSPPYIPGTTKTQITSIASDAEFPNPPVIPDDRELFQCPCCCQSLQAETFKDSKLWKRHLVEDLCPYTCIAENCPTPELLFCTRSEWETHRNMEAMADHLQADHKDELSTKSLSTLLSWSAVQKMGITTCPFCPDHGPEDAPDLVDHVLQEAYEFALRALPWPKPIDHEVNEPHGTFKLPDTGDDEDPISRWLRGSVSEDETAVDLKLCRYDTADHSEPVNPDEYADYFDNGGYFDDKSRDNSSAAQSGFAEAESSDTADRKTLASASTQIAAGDQTADTGEEVADGSLRDRVHYYY